MKSDQSKTKAELIQELQSLQKRISTQDITERTGVEKKLWESEKKYDTLFKESRDAIFISSLDGSSFDFNRSAEELLGYSREELLSLSMEDLYARKEDRLQFRKIIESQGYVKDYELQLRKKDGSVIDCLDSATVRRDMDGNIIGYQGIVRDITERKRADEMLKESEEKFKILTEGQKDVVMRISLGAKLEYCSPAVKEFGGYDPDEEVGNYIAKYFVNKWELKIGLKLIKKFAIDKKTATFEFLYKPKDREPFYVEVTGKPFIKKNKVITIQCVMRDITERKRVEKALKESETKYKEIATSIPGVVYQFIVKKDGSYSFPYVDENCEKFFQHTTKAVVADPNLIFNMVPPDELQSFIDSIEESARTLKEWRHDFRVILPDGQERWFEGRSVPHLLPSGEPFWNGVVTDITERKQAEEAFKSHLEQTKRLRDMVEKLNRVNSLEDAYSVAIQSIITVVQSDRASILLADADGVVRFKDWNGLSLEYRTAVEGQFPWELSDLKAKPICIPDVVKAELPEELMETVLKEGIHACAFIPLIGRDQLLGKFMTYFNQEHIFEPDEMNVVQVLAENLSTVIERLQSQKALRESEEKYRGIFEHTLVGIAVHQNGRVVFANPISAQILGYDSADEFIGKSALKIVHPDYQKIAEERIKRLLSKKGYMVELEEEKFIKKDGTSVDVAVIAQSITYHGTPAIQVSFLDITDLKQAEETLKLSEEKYRGIFNESVAAIYLFDAQKHFIDSNQAGLDLLGYSREELLKMSISEVDADPEAVLTAHKQLLAGDRFVNYEHKLKKKDGSIITVLNNSKPVIDVNGNVVGMQSTLIDITDRKRAEAVENAIYRISEETHSAQNLKSLFSLIHDIVGELIHTKNFYIALYDPDSEMISFPYFIDEYDENPGRKKPGKGLTKYVIRTGISLLASPEVYKELVKNGEVESIGAQPIDWLGVPLKTEDKTIGVIAVQSYTEDIRFGEEEKNILTFVSEQIAMTIERKRAEEELQVSEKKYRQLIDNAYEAIYIAQDGMLVFANPMVNHIMGYSNEELFSNLFTDFIHPDDQKLVYNNYIKRLKGEKVPDHNNFRIIDKKGGIKWLSIRSINIEWDGKPATLNFSSNITRQLRAENALRESEKKFRSVVESSPMGMHIYHLESKDRLVFMGANKAADQILGVDNNQFIGKTIEEAFPQLVETEIPNRYRRAAAQGESWSTEQVIYDDEKISGVFEVYAFQTEPDKMVTMFNDITKRKQADEEIARFSRIFEDSLNEIYLFNETTLNFIQVNRAAQNNLGYTMEELQKLTPLDIKPEFTNESFAELVAPLRKGDREEVVFKTVHKRKDQSLYDVEVHLQLLKHEHEALFAAIVLDITKRKQREEMLVQSENSFRGLYDNATDAIYIQDREGRFLDVNQAVANMYGYPKEFFIGKTPEPLSAPGKNDLKKVAMYIEKAFKGEPQKFEFWGKRKNGEIFPKLVRLKKSVYFGQEVVIAFAMDITERKKNEEEITMLAHALRSINECVSITDLQNRILFVNQSFVDTYGYREDELIGEKINIVSSPNNPPGINESILSETIHGGCSGEIINRRKDGSEFPIQISTTSICNTDNQVIALIGVASDITERKLAEEELRRKMEQIKRANKLMVGRELKMVELKEEVNRLLEKAGLSKKYTTPDEMER